MSDGRSLVATLCSLLLGLSLAGCAPRGIPEAAATDSSQTDLALSGAEIEYVFEIGRRYRARYGEKTVHFELLEPVLPNPPSRSMAYRARAVRDGVYLVAWEGIAYEPVFVIDLLRREVHTRAIQEDGELLFTTAKIVALSYPPDEP